MTEVGDEMQRIVDRDAQNDGRDADDDDRHLTMDKRQTGQGEYPPPPDGHSDKQQVADAAEREIEQQQDQHHGNRYGEDAVGLDLPGITYGYHRTAHKGYRKRRVGGTGLQKLQQTGIVLGLAVAERTVYRHDGPMHAGQEDVALIEFVRD